MGEGRRRKLAGEPPKGSKRENFTRKKECDLVDEFIGPNPLVTAMAMAILIGTKLTGIQRHNPEFKNFEKSTRRLK